MSQIQNTEESLDNPLDETQVSIYLTENPDFFNRNPDLARDLQIPHQCGNAISLIERQTDLLRKKSQQAQQQLAELIQIGQDNDAISQRLQELSLQMIGITNLKALYSSLHDSLCHGFQVDVISLHLDADIGTKDLPASIKVYNLDEFNEMNLGKLLGDQPRCIALAPIQNDYLFDKQDNPIKSAALIPLNDNGKPGLLSLGSCDKERFHSDMDVHFLHYLAKLTEKVISTVVAS
ncbi:MAG: DUF484 family protein [Gammaproteobacteria bacterium]|nr:DUF484 family protein [Gammaproteobacteria bacterium]